MRNFSKSALFVSVALFAINVSTPTQAASGVGSDSVVIADVTPVNTTREKSSWSKDLYVGFDDRYFANEFAISGSPNPGIYAGITITSKDGWWGDVWDRKGSGGQANETDLCGGKNGILGSFQYSTKACYWILSDGKRNYLASLKDDALYGSGDLALPFQYRRIDLALHAKVMLLDGVNDLGFYANTKVGATAGFKVTDNMFGQSDSLSVNLEFAHAWHLATKTPDPWIFVASLPYHATDGITLIVTGKVDYFDHRFDHTVMGEVHFAL